MALSKIPVGLRKLNIHNANAIPRPVEKVEEDNEAFINEPEFEAPKVDIEAPATIEEI